MRTSDIINDIASALAKAQAKMKGAVKDANNPFFKSKYADLASVWEACREALTTNGISVVQGLGAAGAVVTVTTRLLHLSGQWLESELSVPAKAPDAQGIGSALTYARRYALAAMAGVAPEDDDGESAVGRGVQTATTAAGKHVVVKMATATGEVKEKKPEWSKEQTAEASALRAKIIELGGKPGDDECCALYRKMKYDAPADVIDAMAAMALRWEDIKDAADSVTA